MTEKGGEWKSASWKKEEDHSGAANAVHEKINATTVPVLLLSSTDTLEQLVDQLLAVEKKARFGGDVLSTQKLAVEVIKILRTQGKKEEMLTTLDVLMKKRGQMKQVQSAMINEAAEALNVAGMSRDERVELLTRLKFLAEGKIHVELEHARFTMSLAKLLIEDNVPGVSAELARANKRHASDILHSIQVETITSMPPLEKVESVLMQIRLALDLDNMARCAILSRKMNPRALAKPDRKPYKVRYFKLMAEYYERQRQWYAMARCWYDIHLTIPGPDDNVPAAKAQDSDDDSDVYQGTTRLNALSNAIVLAILSPPLTSKEIDDACECSAFSKDALAHDDRGEWLKALAALREVQHELPGLHELLTAFNEVELIRTSHAAEIDRLAESHPQLAGHADRREQLYARLSEHDILAISRFYKRVHLQRLADLVGLPLDPTEQFIMTMVTTKTIYAKIDRIEGVVVFEKTPVPVDIVTRWNTNVEKLATLVDRTCHLVAKERMLLAAGAQTA